VLGSLKNRNWGLTAGSQADGRDQGCISQRCQKRFVDCFCRYHRQQDGVAEDVWECPSETRWEVLSELQPEH
jgi:hypothetical protein